MILSSFRMSLLTFSAIATSAVMTFSHTTHAFTGQVFTGFMGQTNNKQMFYTVAVDEKTQQGAKAFIEKMSGDAIGFLGNSALSQSEKQAEFKKLLQNNFAIDTIARFSLGRYWNSATNVQRKDYLNLFEKMIVRVYTKRFDDYEGQDLIVRGVRAEGSRDSLVQSVIVPNGSGPEVKVDWRVRKKDGQYKIVDVTVEGVSMAATQRSDFASVIQRGGGNIQVLIDHLRENG